MGRDLREPAGKTGATALSSLRDRWRAFLVADLGSAGLSEPELVGLTLAQMRQRRAFPFVTYDMAKLIVAIAVYQLFLSPLALVAVGLAAGSVVVAQVFSQRRAAAEAEPLDAYRTFVRVVLLRAAVWSAIYAYVLTAAPFELLIFLVPGALLVLFIDGLTMMTVPKRAMTTVMMHTGAVVVPLVFRGDMPSLLAAVMVGCAAVFLNWCLFTFHHMYASRLKQARRLGEARDTIQLLLNQYDEDGSDWLFECDEVGAIVRPNARFCAAARRSREELNGLRLSLLLDDGPEREELRGVGEREEPFRDLVIPLTIEGKQHWWSITARPVRDPDGRLTGWRGFVADVTRTRAAEAQVTYMAHYDVLTGLPNRSLFQTTLSRAFARRAEGALLALLYVDLDHFKAVNDTYGHGVGDAVLAEAASRIEAAVSPSATVARLGGDEFAVILDKVSSRDEAIAQAAAIVDAMGEPVSVDDRALPLGASVGVAFAPEDGLDGETVLRAADLALYDAKARGRHGVSVFDAAMEEEASERRTLALDLRVALSAGQLAIHYQPLIDADSLDVLGYEALLRWTHPTHGEISPSIFVPVAEESGQIVAIGSWVLNEALREAARWPGDRFVSVNLSPAQLRDERFLAVLVGALAASGLDPARLELEITETVLMGDDAATIALLHKIRELGVGIALDDFGTGYSSLGYLRRYPFTKIKIDRCFVSDMDKATDSDAIVRAVVEMADRLNMVATAEGVESAEQLDRLRRSGCRQLQGFLFSAAVPASTLDRLDGTELPAGPADVATLPSPADKTATERRRRA